MIIQCIMENSGFPYLSSNVYLVQLNGSIILVDTGNFFLQEKLIAALQEHHLTPSDIRLVINTHLHFDHFGNNSLFNEAVFYMPFREIKYLMPVLEMDKNTAMDYFAMYYPQIPRDKLKNFTRMILAQKFQLEWIQCNRDRIIPINRDIRLNKELRFIHTFGGHSPGHICPIIQNGEEIIGFTGDIFFPTDQDSLEQGMMIFMNRGEAINIQNFISQQLDIAYPGHGTVQKMNDKKIKKLLNEAE